MWIYPQSSKKIDRTLEYSTTALLDDIFVVTRGSKQDQEKKLFDILNKMEKVGYRASKRKSEFFMIQAKWLGHEIDEHRIKPNEEKVEAILKLNHPKLQRTEIISRGVTIHGKVLTKTFRTDGSTEKIIEEK